MSEEILDGTLADENYDPDLITLEDEDGEEHVFEVLDAADVDDIHYLALVPYFEDPAQQLDDDAELLLMRVGEENGEEYLDVVDDQQELVRVGQIFLDRLADVYDVDLDDLINQLRDEE